MTSTATTTSSTLRCAKRSVALDHSCCAFVSDDDDNGDHDHDHDDGDEDDQGH